jgi:hypothetical protein
MFECSIWQHDQTSGPGVDNIPLVKDLVRDPCISVGAPCLHDMFIDKDWMQL